MPHEVYTFNQMRSDLIRRLVRSSPARTLSDGFKEEVVSQMIVVIDAMTPEERALGNVLSIPSVRQGELAKEAGTTVAVVNGICSARAALDRVKTLLSGDFDWQGE
jgi:signal recognition particle GTPase